MSAAAVPAPGHIGLNVSRLDRSIDFYRGDSGGLFFEDPDGIRLEIFAPRGVAGAPAPHADGPTCGFF